MKVYIINENSFLSSYKYEEENYILKNNETDLIPNYQYYKPKFINNIWIEGMTENEKNTIAIPVLLKKQSFENTKFKKRC